MPQMTLPNDPGPLQTYSDILNLRQQAQTLQTGQALQQTAQQEAIIRQQQAWQEQQKTSEMQFMAQKAPQILKDPQAYGPDGVLNADYVASQLAPGMPTTWPDVAQHIYQTQSSAIGVKTAALGFNTAEREAVATAISGPAQDPNFQLNNPSDVADFISRTHKLFPDEVGPMIDAVFDGAQIPKTDANGQPLKQYTPEQAAGIKQHLQILINPLLSPGEMAKKAGVMDVGGANVPIVQAPGIAGGGIETGQPIRKGLPPGAVVVKDAYDNQFILNPQTNTVTPVGTGHGVGAGGRVTAPGPKVGGAGTPVTAPPGRTFHQPVPNQGQIQSDIAQTRHADADYGTNRHINDSILRLSSNTSTGPGTEAWHNFFGGALSPVQSNNISDYQTIGAFLDRQAALSTKQMGLPETNAGLTTAAGLSGTTSYQPAALQTKVRLTDALVEGAHQYRQGLDKVVGTGPNQDLSRYNDFTKAWANNFDPNVFRAENDLKRGDKADILALKQEVGANGWKDLQKKSKALGALTNGQIPNE